VDAIGGYAQEFVMLPDAVMLRWFENGVDAYGTTVVANDDFLNEQPDVAERFMRAAARGLEFTRENPEEAAQITADLGEGDADYFLAELEQLDVFFDDEHGSGFEMNEDRWTSTRDLVATFGELEDEVDLDEVYTNTYLE
jgi:NitT/TauT family transport system substrate-binding protein